MSHTGFILWFIGMAVATIVILAFGTLGAAEIVPLGRKRPRADREEPVTGDEPGTSTTLPADADPTSVQDRPAA